MALPKPVSRADMYLSYLNYTKGLTLANLPKPVSRADMYLYNLCINRGIGGGSGGSNVTLNGEPQTNFNFIGDENSTISALQIGEKTYSFNGGSSSGDGNTTDNVVDRAGRTQEQINRTFYKRMCKEIPSPSGEPITVENGEEGYVLSAEIKGQTVKNYAKNGISYVYDGTKIQVYNSPIILQSNERYCIIYNVTKTTGSNIRLEIMLDDDTVQIIQLDTSTVGLRKTQFTPTKQVKHIYRMYLLTGEYDTGSRVGINNFIVVEDKYSQYVNSYIPFGLSSTEAIISNNGMKYPIYHPTETNEDGSKKVILLAKVGDIVDSLTVSEEGNGIYTRYLNKILFDGSEPWQLVEDREKTLRFNYINTSAGVYLNGVGALDKVPFGNPRSGDVEGFSCLNNAFCISVLKDKLETHDLNGFKTWLSINIPKGIYQLATPVITHIPKELVPTILTQQTNILEVGGAVKPSSFKVTLPVDRIAELTARLEAVEAKTNTQPVNTAFVDETYAKSVNKIEEVIK